MVVIQPSFHRLITLNIRKQRTVSSSHLHAVVLQKGEFLKAEANNDKIDLEKFRVENVNEKYKFFKKSFYMAKTQIFCNLNKRVTAVKSPSWFMEGMKAVVRNKNAIYKKSVTDKI